MSVTVPLARARRAVAAAFFCQGLVFIHLTTRLPVFARRWDLSETELSLLLLMMVLLAGLGSALAERRAARRGSAELLLGGVLAVGTAPLLLGGAPSGAVFAVVLAAYGLALGMVDASSNMQAVALEHRYARAILPSFHGAWTLGGVVGAALTLATAGRPTALVVADALVCAAPLLFLVARFLPREEAGPAPAAPDEVPWRPMLLVGLALVVFYMVDTAATTWGPTYLDRTFTTPSGLVALATFPYLLASGLLRIVGDRLVTTYGAVVVLRVGALLASAALAVVVLAPTWPVAVLGFTLLGAGVAVIAPLSFSAAARIAGGDGLDTTVRRARVDAVIARFNQFNYVGALLGAVLTGVVGAGSLRIGFALPMVLVLAILPLARSFAPVSPRRPPASSCPAAAPDGRAARRRAR